MAMTEDQAKAFGMIQRLERIRQELREVRQDLLIPQRFGKGLARTDFYGKNNVEELRILARDINHEAAYIVEDLRKWDEASRPVNEEKPPLL